MRDLQHLEELSAVTAFGSWANDIVVALEGVAGGPPESAEDRGLLLQAAEFLATLADPTLWRTRPPSARSLAASEATRSAVTSVLGTPPGEDQVTALRDLASAAREAAYGKLTPERAEYLPALMRLFDRVGDLQLARSNAVLTARKDSFAWTATRLTSVS